MKPTGNAIKHPASSCNPSTKKNPDPGLKRFLHGTIRPCVMAGLFILSTSYQSHKNELVLMENDFYIPAFTGCMERLFQTDSVLAGFENRNTRIKTTPLVEEFYSDRQYSPAWTNGTTENNQAGILLNLLENAERFGLANSLFPLREIRRELDQMKNKEQGMNYLQSRMNAELLLSDACLQFMLYLNKGYRDFTMSLYSLPEVMTMPHALNNALAGHDFEKKMLSVQPDRLEYRNLQKALELFLTHSGRSDTRIAIPDPAEDSCLFRDAAQAVLISLGYLGTGSTDTAFVKALKSFQYYHGLEPDGKAGKSTRKAMEKTSEEKFRQIALNLDRIRKENIQAERFISVNIPAYHLKIYKGNQIMGTSRVIVGSVHTPTPLISGKIERIITNPVWQVPRSITLREMLPKLKSDSEYLSRNRLRLMDENQNTVSYHQVDWNTISAESFDYKIRQDAGEDNALGRIKFVFPNPYSVYLHDTPGKLSFSRENRALSHGCVRVQEPGMLADYLISEFSPRYQGPDPSGMMEKGIRREIMLDEPVDIYIRYLTCEADENHHIYFYQDIYGLDNKELKNLEFLP